MTLLWPSRFGGLVGATSPSGIPVIWQKKSQGEPRKICNCNHDAFHERQVLRRLACGEHLAGKDWVIGSEVEVCKVSYPHGAGKMTKSSAGRGPHCKATARRQDTGTPGECQTKAKTRSSGCLAQHLICAKSQGSAISDASPPGDGFLIRIGQSLFAEQCAMAGGAGVSEREVAAGLRNW